MKTAPTLLSQFLSIIVLASCFLSAATGQPTGSPPGMPASLATSINELPRTTKDPLTVLRQFSSAADEVTITRQTGEESYIVVSTTTGKLFAQVAKEDVNPIPSNPEPGDEITVSQTRVYGNQRWRTTYTYTWMRNPDTGGMEWMLTATSTKFLGYVYEPER